MQTNRMSSWVSLVNFSTDSQGGGGGGRGGCYNCHQDGHIARECPEQRQERYQIDPLDNPWAWRSPLLKPLLRSDWKFYDQRELSILYSAANHSLSTLLHNMCPLYQCIFCENLGHHMVTFMKYVFSTFIFHTTIQRVVNLFDGILQRDVK